MLLTIIAPIFNTGKYLSKCVDSVLAQDLDAKDYEILLVYDQGSTDNGLEIAQEYAQKCSHVRLVSHSNRSIGESLNYAFSLAKGKYIEVVDTDDYLEPNRIGSLIKRMEEQQLDILRFAYQNVNENYQVYKFNSTPNSYINYSNSITNGMDFLTRRMGFACYVPTFIFLKELLLRPGNEMLPIAINDAEWLPRIVMQANRISSTDVIIYNYVIREGSKMHNSNLKKRLKILDEHFVVLEYYQKQLATLQDKRWYKGGISAIVMAILGRVVTDCYKQNKIYINRLQQYNIFPLSFFHQSFRSRIRISIINLSPTLYCWLLHLWRQ